jgi:hypothetical protein
MPNEQEDGVVVVFVVRILSVQSPWVRNIQYNCLVLTPNSLSS